MNIKILSSLKIATRKRNDLLIIGTHNGIFHADEVVACAILCLLYSNMSVQILRTRDEKLLTQCDICVDIGGGKYDHHQKGFNKARKNGVKYASAGLVWNSYGRELLSSVMKKYFSEEKSSIVDALFKSFDDSFIIPVDYEDNGVAVETHHFSFISSFLPLWFNNTQNDFNNKFHKALMTTISILEELIKSSIGKEITKEILFSRYKSEDYYFDGILEIPSQTIDWLETTIEINSSNNNRKINFVIFPYPAGGWAAQCVPPSLSEKFAQRIPFPSEWAGQTDKLPEISKVEGANFCHNGCFFIRATSKEAVVKLCNIATK